MWKMSEIQNLVLHKCLILVAYLPVSMIRNSMLYLPKVHADSARDKDNLFLVYLPLSMIRNSILPYAYLFYFMILISLLLFLLIYFHLFYVFILRFMRILHVIKLKANILLVYLPVSVIP